jgi:hypothetical protein
LSQDSFENFWFLFQELFNGLISFGLITGMAAKTEIANPMRTAFATSKDVFNLKRDIFNTAVGTFSTPLGQQILFDFKPE